MTVTILFLDFFLELMKESRSLHHVGSISLGVSILAGPTLTMHFTS